MNGLLLACQIEGVSTRKDRTVSVKLGTQEMSPANAGQLLGMANQLVAVYLSPKETISQREVDQVDAVNPEFPGKSQSQRLRNVLFVLWQSNSEGYKDFDAFYRHSTELIIDNIKSKLPTA